MNSHASARSGSPHRKYELKLDLARFRSRAGIALEDIAQRTKISSRFLRAIEEERFDQLPGGIFSTSYLRQYAAVVGYDEEALLAYYVRKTNPAAVSPKSAPQETGKTGLLHRWLRTVEQTSR